MSTIAERINATVAGASLRFADAVKAPSQGPLLPAVPFTDENADVSDSITGIRLLGTDGVLTTIDEVRNSDFEGSTYEQIREAARRVEDDPSNANSDPRLALAATVAVAFIVLAALAVLSYGFGQLFTIELGS